VQIALVLLLSEFPLSDCFGEQAVVRVGHGSEVWLRLMQSRDAHGGSELKSTRAVVLVSMTDEALGGCVGCEADEAKGELLGVAIVWEG
jgi:hypothetical protein